MQCQRCRRWKRCWSDWVMIRSWGWRGWWSWRRRWWSSRTWNSLININILKHKVNFVIVFMLVFVVIWLQCQYKLIPDDKSWFRYVVLKWEMHVCTNCTKQLLNFRRWVKIYMHIFDHWVDPYPWNWNDYRMLAPKPKTLPTCRVISLWRIHIYDWSPPPLCSS